MLTLLPVLTVFSGALIVLMMRIPLRLSTEARNSAQPKSGSCSPFSSMIYIFFGISKEGIMQVAKWGNSLAVRLPKALVDALDLKEGDEIEIVVAGTHRFEIVRDKSREAALDRLRALKRPLPKGFRFDRNEANDR